MLNISERHMAALQRAAVAEFENEMAAHANVFAPKLSAVLGEDQLRVAIREMIERVAKHGFTNRGPVRLCIEMMFLFGSGFEDDPQYPWTGAILGVQADQMDRANRLYKKVLEYQEKVSGPEGIHTRDALRRLATLSGRLPALSAAQFVEGTIWEIANVFPEKARYLGKAALQALVHEGIALARKAGFGTSRSYTVLIALMFAFGHRCAEDPLYPWIGRTLQDPRIIDATARAERLERKAMTWLNHVLGN